MNQDWSQYKPESFEYNGKWIKNWFSNMAYSGIEIDGIIYGSVENYYQLQKCTNPEIWEKFARLAPSQVKKLGRNLDIRKDWEEVKYDVMKKGLLAKFSQPLWKSQLLETGDEMIIEWNNWGDRIWGVDVRDNKGQNLLGKALMEIRKQLKTNQL